MLVLTKPIKLTESAIKSANLCSLFDDEDLKRIGVECYEGYSRDEQSRQVWLRRNEAGMDLALQISKDKSFPWPGCANVAFPLVTIAAMQFHARAYPAIVGESQIVKCLDFSEGQDPEVAARSKRISSHMSWQLIYQDKGWEEQEDTAIFNLSIVGTNFKKSYYSSARKCNVSELVLAKDLVLNYWAKSVEACPRKTHKLPTFRNEVYENVMRGKWRDVLEEQWYVGSPAPRQTTQKIEQDKRQGVTPPQPDDASALMFLEQHCDMDLDDDGYAEPYIITFEETSKTVVRIVCRFNSEADIERVASGANKGKIIRIEATEYFTQKIFIPSPDGGVYGIGFGVFLGPLNEAVNSLVNMLLDSGTMQTTAGGFLGRGAKIRGGPMQVGPFEWKRVDSTGDDLRKSIFPLPVNAPSDVLFQLLSLLINYTSRVSGTTDITVGENPGQNTPAQTTQTMVEMGQKIYTAIFKRIWRSLKKEYEKLFKLNAVFLPREKTLVGGAKWEDYQSGADQVCPVADPNITSDGMRIQMAMTLKAAAAANSQGYNLDEVERRFLKAIRVDNIDQVYPGAQGKPPPKDPKLVIAEAKIASDEKIKSMDLQARQQEFVMTLMEERKMNNAKILELMAKADNESANAQTEQAYAQVAAINAEIGRMRAQNEHINKQIEHFIRIAELESTHHLGVKQLEKAAA